VSIEIGGKIKEIRKYLNISQSELCEGICTQSLISQIEKGETTPTAEILHHISKRLGVDINYFFTITETPGEDYASLVIQDLEEAVRYANYKDVLEIIKVEKRNPLFKHPPLKQILLWREAICHFHLYEDMETAIELIDHALALTTTTYKNYSEEELKILNSKSILLSQSGAANEANNIINELMSCIKKIRVRNDPKIEINILFNGSIISVLLKNYEEAIERAEKGIQECVKKESLYLLGELYYQKGKSLYLESPKNLTQAILLMEDALWIFSRTGNKKFYKFVNIEVKKLKHRSCR